MGREREYWVKVYNLLVVGMHYNQRVSWLVMFSKDGQNIILYILLSLTDSISTKKRNLGCLPLSLSRLLNGRSDAVWLPRLRLALLVSAHAETTWVRVFGQAQAASASLLFLAPATMWPQPKENYPPKRKGKNKEKSKTVRTAQLSPS